MKLFKKIFKNTNKRNLKSAIIPIPQDSMLHSVFSFRGWMSPGQAIALYEQNSTINTAVEKIAEKIEQITPVVKDKNDKIIPEHPILELLKRPNAFENWREFVGDLIRNYLITHNAFVGQLGNVSRLPLELYSVKPFDVAPVIGVDNYPATYSVTTGIVTGNYERVEQNRKVRFLDSRLKELVHIKGYCSRSGSIMANSPIESILLETQHQIKGKYHNLKVLDNGGRLSLVVTFKEADQLGDDEYKERERRINEDLGGPANAGKIAILSGEDVAIQEVGTHNKDMDFVDLERMATEVIYLRYGVPLPLITTDASTYNNFETALFDFYENTILPVADHLFDVLTDILFFRLNEKNLSLSYNSENINILVRQKLDQLEKRKKIGIETTNELRALIPKREPLKGGDIWYIPANYMPAGEDLFTDDNYDSEAEIRKLEDDLKKGE